MIRIYAYACVGKPYVKLIRNPDGPGYVHCDDNGRIAADSLRIKDYEAVVNQPYGQELQSHGWERCYSTVSHVEEDDVWRVAL